MRKIGAILLEFKEVKKLRVFVHKLNSHGKAKRETTALQSLTISKWSPVISFPMSERTRSDKASAAVNALCPEAHDLWRQRFGKVAISQNSFTDRGSVDKDARNQNSKSENHTVNWSMIIFLSRHIIQNITQRITRSVEE